MSYFADREEREALEDEAAASDERRRRARELAAELGEGDEEDEPSYWFAEGYSVGRYDTPEPEGLDDLEAEELADYARGLAAGLTHPCGCPAAVVLGGVGGPIEQCSRCGTSWPRPSAS